MHMRVFLYIQGCFYTYKGVSIELEQVRRGPCTFWLSLHIVLYGMRAMSALCAVSVSVVA